MAANASVSTLLFSLLANCGQASSLLHLHAQPFHSSMPLLSLFMLNFMLLIKGCLPESCPPWLPALSIICFYLAPAIMCLVRDLCWFLSTSLKHSFHQSQCTYMSIAISAFPLWEEGGSPILFKASFHPRSGVFPCSLMHNNHSFYLPHS